MNRTFLKLAIIAVAASALCACTRDDYDYKGEIEEIKLQLAQQKALINVLQKAVTVTDIQKGTDSFTITFSTGDSYTITNGYTPLITIGENGNWFINGEDTGEPSRGENGRDGNQYRIEIGSDGYWYINGQNTGVKAAGIDGRNGIDGKDGKDGVDGKDGRDGDNGKDGKDGKDGQNGKDATPPIVEIRPDGFWYINGINTGVKAVGVDGKDGVNGKDATPPIIEISSDGYWYINNRNTGVKAAASDGKDGADGRYITSITENYTYFTFNFSDGTSVDVKKQQYAYISSNRISGTLAATAILSLKENYIRPNTMLTASVSFDTFSGIYIGRGYQKNGGGMLEITASEVKVHKYVTSDSVIGTYSHGLTLSGSLYVVVDAGWDGANISLYSNGKEYKFSVEGWLPGGAPFVYNIGGKEISVDLSFFPYDVTSGVWVVGDEFAGGWLPNIHSIGASPLADWHPGATAADMLDSFRNDLEYGNPAYVLWALGDNDKPDGSSVDETWLAATQSFLDICKQRGITPVLATIYSSQHSQKTKWVRETGKCRYVDFALAGSNPVEMAYRVLVDLPEISQAK